METNGSTTWLIVGSSLRAAEFVNPALKLALVHGWRTATCNSGWQLFATALKHPVGLWIAPTWFWLSDHEACLMRTHQRALGVMRALGTKLVTVERGDPAMYERLGLANPDAIAPPGPGSADRGPFVPGEWCRPKFSGLMLLQWILNTQAPERIILIGFDGYGSSSGGGRIVRDTIDGRPGQPSGEEDTREIIAPFIQSCLDALPEVSFVLCGSPQYVLASRANLTLVSQPEQLEASL